MTTNKEDKLLDILKDLDNLIEIYSERDLKTDLNKIETQITHSVKFIHQYLDVPQVIDFIKENTDSLFHDDIMLELLEKEELKPITIH